MIVWQANEEIFNLLNKIKEQHHHPRLERAAVAVCFNESKPFKKGRFNWGNVSKFSSVSRIWQQKPYDFCLTLSSDAWVGVLDNSQKEAWLDLCLTRCDVEYKPVVTVENGKSIPVKDEFGRIEYTDEIKEDKESFPLWRVNPLGVEVIQSNVKRYGTWCQDFLDLKEVLEDK